MEEPETTNQPADPKKSALETLLPKANSVIVGEDKVPINDFCFAKTVRMLSLLSDLSTALGLTETVANAVTPQTPKIEDEYSFLEDKDVSAATEPTEAPKSFLLRLLEKLPGALANGTPALYKVFGLIVTSNKTLRDLDEDDKDVDTYLLKAGKGVAYEGTLDQLIELLMVGIGKIGIETILGNAGRLMGILRLVS